METNVTQKKLRILLIREKDMVAAQCLEHDIVTQGKDMEQALRRLETVLRLYIKDDLEEGIEPLSNIPQAPKMYWDMFFGESHIIQKRLRTPVKTSIPYSEILADDLRLAGAMA